MRTVFRIYELKSAFDLGIEIDRYTNYMVMCKVGMIMKPTRQRRKRYPSC